MDCRVFTGGRPVLCQEFRAGSGDIGEIALHGLRDTQMRGLAGGLGLGLIGGLLNQGMLELVGCFADLQYQSGVPQYAQIMRQCGGVAEGNLAQQIQIEFGPEGGGKLRGVFRIGHLIHARGQQVVQRGRNACLIVQHRNFRHLLNKQRYAIGALQRYGKGPASETSLLMDAIICAASFSTRGASGSDDSRVSSQGGSNSAGVP